MAFDTYYYPAYKYESHFWISVDDICHYPNGNIVCFQTEDEAVNYIKNTYGIPLSNGEWSIPFGDEWTVYAIKRVC